MASQQNSIDPFQTPEDFGTYEKAALQHMREMFHRKHPEVWDRDALTANSQTQPVGKTEIQQIEDILNEGEDLVNAPKHYATGQHETISVIREKLTAEQFQGYLMGNIIKYITRSNLKGKFDQDCEKAQYYLNTLVGFNNECR